MGQTVSYRCAPGTHSGSFLEPYSVHPSITVFGPQPGENAKDRRKRGHCGCSSPASHQGSVHGSRIKRPVGEETDTVPFVSGGWRKLTAASGARHMFLWDYLVHVGVL